MIIHISKSILFTEDPDRRFAREYGLPQGLWNLMYNRSVYLNYSIEELCDLYEVKTKKQISRVTMRRWVWRTEIYRITLPLIKKGAQTVVSDIFGEHEADLIKELTKHLKSGETKDSRIVI